MEKFECKHCNYTSSNKTHFQRHCLTSIKHLSYEESKNYCTLCNKQYDSNKNYKYHKYNCHKRKENKKKTLIKKNAENKNDDNKIKKIKPTDIDVIKQNQEEIIEEIKDVKVVVKDVKFVVNNAISKASTLIKYLMEHQQDTPPLKKINFKQCLDRLRLDFNCPDTDSKNDYLLEKKLIKEYINGTFIENLCKSILNLIKNENYKFTDNKELTKIYIKPIVKNIDILLLQYSCFCNNEFINNIDEGDFEKHIQYLSDIFQFKKYISDIEFENSLINNISKQLSQL